MPNDPNQDKNTAARAENNSPEDIVRRLMADDTEGVAPYPASAQRNDQSTNRAKPVKPSFVSRVFARPKSFAIHLWDRVSRAVLAYRPTPRHLAIVLLAFIVVTLPLLIPVMIAVALVITLISYLSLGHDRSQELANGAFGWYDRHNPENAYVIRAGAVRMTSRLTVLLGYLPERWTTGLYLPDFTQPDDLPEKMADDPFERLAGETQNR